MTRSFTNPLGTGTRKRPTIRPQAEALEGRLLLTAGDLDPTFGTGGSVLTSPTIQSRKAVSGDYAEAVQLQSDGKILVAGSTIAGGNTDWGLVRLMPSGAIDTSFGSGGRVVTDFLQARDEPYDMALDADGNIVLVGLVSRPTKIGKTVVQDSDFGIARYTPNGALDLSFNGSGKASTNISSYTTQGSYYKRDEARAVAIQADGKIVVGGASWTGDGTAVASMVRYNADGSLDTTFGVGGKVTNSASPTIHEIELLPDGKILAVGAARSPAITRTAASIRPSGRAGPASRPSTRPSGYLSIRDMAILSNGTILAAGEHQHRGE